MGRARAEVAVPVPIDAAIRSARSVRHLDSRSPGFSAHFRLW